MAAQKVQANTVLDAVIATGTLGNSSRYKDLLSYLLTEEMEGRGAQLTAYSIALNVLGRDQNFDSNTDSIVRVSMHKLRKKLIEFNEQSTEYTLHIPKAIYRISLDIHTAPQSDAQNTQSFLHKHIRIFRNPWTILSGLSGFVIFVFLAGRAFLSPNLSTQATHRICSTERPNLALPPTNVVGEANLGTDAAAIADNYLHTGLAQYHMVNLVPDTIDCRKSGTPFYTLRTQIFATAEQPYISIHARHETSQNIILTERIDIPQNSQNMGSETSWAFYKMASKLANADGVLLNDASSRAWRDLQTQQDYQCLSLALMKYVHFTEESYQGALKCTRDVVDKKTNVPEFYALLANFYINQARGRHPVSISNPMDEAQKLIDTAVKLQPLNSDVLAVQLQMYAVAPQDNTELIKLNIRHIEQQSPYNPHMLLLISQISGVKLGDWEQSKTYTEQTLKLDDSNAHDLYYMEFVYAFLFESPEIAYEKALKIYYPKSEFATVANLAAANKADMLLHAQACKDALALLGLQSISDYTTIIRKSNYHQQFEDELIKWVSFTP